MAHPAHRSRQRTRSTTKATRKEKDLGVTVEEALVIAKMFQKRGQLEQAGEILKGVLHLVPDHPEALHFSGVLAQQRGQSDEAAALIARSLEPDPGLADWHSNYGIVLRAQGKLAESAAAYRRAIALDPTHAHAHNNLGVNLSDQGQLVEAESAFREATRLNPNYFEAFHNLGMLLGTTGRSKEAVLCYSKVTTLNPKHPDARRLRHILPMAHRALGEHEKAKEILQQWRDEEPDNPVPQHILATFPGEKVPPRASDAYVQKVFDQFAASFDEKLAHLSYQAPRLMGAMLEDAGVPPAHAFDVLDAGCGTGLCGPILRPWAKTLTGVDLSAGMLEKAKTRGGYDTLVHRELTTFLREHAEAFDLIVSADTLVYFGALEEVVAAAGAALRPGGLLLFSLEEEPDASTDTYRIQTHGRYAHRQDYVEGLLVAHGLQPHTQRAHLRMEGGVPVDGLVIRATKGLAGATREVTHG